MINVGEHFSVTARNLLVQNEKGIMRAIHNSQTPGICANNFFKLIAPIWSGLVCNGFATSPALQISLFVRAGPKIVHNAMSTLLLSNDFLLFPWLKPECDVKRLNAKWYTHLSAFLPFWSWRKSSHILNAVGRVSMYRWKWSLLLLPSGLVAGLPPSHTPTNSGGCLTLRDPHHHQCWP